MLQRLYYIKKIIHIAHDKITVMHDLALWLFASGEHGPVLKHSGSDWECSSVQVFLFTPIEWDFWGQT